jgi:peptide methionine sulfoxide reductase msrA/msrB
MLEQLGIWQIIFVNAQEHRGIQVTNYTDKKNSLMPIARKVLCEKGTELAHSGIYTELVADCSYMCRRCGLALFRSNTQFDSRCGWPSFDESIADHVTSKPDWDGQRIEVCCARCDGHLGHVFIGEELTLKNRRYCINSCALDFVENAEINEVSEILVAGGCFWGVEYYMRLLPGVVDAEVGYMGGELENPTYLNVHSGNSGHYEAVRVLFEPQKVTEQQVLKYFFEIHDPTQENGQGADLGQPYHSVVFYHDAQQKKNMQKIIAQLTASGYKVATKILPAQVFWLAEEEHQQYHAKHHTQPACHHQVKRFKD